METTKQYRQQAMPMLNVRAQLQPKSIDVEQRTIEVVIATDKPVRMWSWEKGSYLETLSMDPAHVRMERINAGVSLLNSHSQWDLNSVLGRVMPGTVTISGGKMRGTVKFSNRAEVAGIWQDVQDGIVQDISVGYAVHRADLVSEDKVTGTKTYKAVDWEPMEVSMVPVPADHGAKVRSAENAQQYTAMVEGAEVDAPSTETEDEQQRLALDGDMVRMAMARYKHF